MKTLRGPDNFIGTQSAKTWRPVACGEQIPVSAGGARALFVDGELRYLSVGSHEIIRRISAPIRDASWGTVPTIIKHAKLLQDENAFHIDVAAESHAGEIHVTSRTTISARASLLPDGRARIMIVYLFRADALATFDTCRTGICVLHPIRECRGLGCTVETADGRVNESQFPDLIAPHQPFTNIRSMSFAVSPEVWTNIGFEGEVFETEDQRNWTDSSFKTYCRPLSRPFPYKIQKGDAIHQSATATILIDALERSGAAELYVNEQSVARIGQIGVGVALGEPSRHLSVNEASRLRSLNLSHVRLDIHLDGFRWEHTLASDILSAERIGVPIEIALHLPANTSEIERELGMIAALLGQVTVGIARCIVYEIGRHMTSARAVELVRHGLAGNPGLGNVGGGTAANFAELNRNQPSRGAMSLVAWPINPQRHAGDSLTLIENLASQRDTVLTARSFAPTAILVVSPVTMHHIPDPAAAGKKGTETETEVVVTDPRQQQLLGAVWTLGSLKYLLESGVDAATFFQASGPLGIMEAERVFPLYHVLADVAEFAGGEVLTCSDPNPLSFLGLFLRQGRRRRFIVANLRSEAQSIAVSEIRGLQCAGGYTLDPATLNLATHEPEAFRLKAANWTGTFPETLNLPSYSIARFDLA